MRWREPVGRSRSKGLRLGRSGRAERRTARAQWAVPYCQKGNTGQEALKTLDGKPIIAGDTNDIQYFKRLRVAASDLIVLESLDSGGDYGPVFPPPPGKGKNCLVRVWPVAGVLFDILPNRAGEAGSVIPNGTKTQVLPKIPQCETPTNRSEKIVGRRRAPLNGNVCARHGTERAR